MRNFFALVFTAILFATQSTFAQLAILRDNGTGNPILTSPYREVKGTHYIEDFKIGTMYLPNGQKVEGLQLALNGYENTLEYKLDGSLFAYTADKLAGFAFTSPSGELIEYTTEYVIPTLSKRRYLKVVEKGKYTLLHHQYKIMTDDVTATYGAQAAKVFQNQEEFFVARDGEVFLLKNKPKDLEQIFRDDSGKVSTLIKSQKTNFKNPEDLKSLIRQLNQ
ncbi:MAG: hypothetical protein MUE75_00450 [Algoriphagus sp.]|jgi:hypothetical protein|nr:hypothetical protein [Algoriphagus sp.]